MRGKFSDCGKIVICIYIVVYEALESYQWSGLMMRTGNSWYHKSGRIYVRSNVEFHFMKTLEFSVNIFSSRNNMQIQNFGYNFWGSWHSEAHFYFFSLKRRKMEEINLGKYKGVNKKDKYKKDTAVDWLET